MRSVLQAPLHLSHSWVVAGQHLVEACECLQGGQQVLQAQYLRTVPIKGNQYLSAALVKYQYPGGQQAQ
jgi:hypothetical protein